MNRLLDSVAPSRYFIVSIALVVVLTWSCQSVREKEVTDNDQPNIIIIYADDVGYGDIGVYGSQLIPTPHIDQLAADGIRFISAYASASTCTPSRYSLLTGEYAFRNERAQILPGNAPLLIEPGSPTLPEVLRNAGYRTSVVGKWHLGLGEGDVDWNRKIKPGPLEVGFDESFLLPATNDRVPTVYVDGYYVKGLSEDDDPLRVSYDGPIGELPTGHSHPELLHYPADNYHSGTIVSGISRIGWQDGGQSAWWDDQQMAILFTEKAQDFIRRHQQNPFFLYLSMHNNHVPRWPHPRFVGQCPTGLRGDAIVELDWVVGQIAETLESLGIREETLVIFTSDNGPIFDDGYDDGAIEEARGHPASGHFRGGKYHAFEGGTRLPFIASWPGTIDYGLVSHAIISQVDMLATLAALTGAELSHEAGKDSYNLLSELLGQSEVGREYVLQQGRGAFGLRKGPWKLIHADSQPPSWTETNHNRRLNPLSTPQVEAGTYLFNLDRDPGETTNLVDDYTAIANELSTLLEEIRSKQ